MVRFHITVREAMMQRWLATLLLAGAMLGPGHAEAQTPITLSGVLVQLWPEYDQPRMLVIYDFNVAEGTQLPVSVSLKFPKDANLVAVAVHQDGDALLNADYLESQGDENWRSVLVQVQTPATYRIEYYQPLSMSGTQRQFTFLWPGGYAIEDFNLSLRMPADAEIVRTEPPLERGETDAATYFMAHDFNRLGADDEFEFHLEYTRSTDALVAPPENLGPPQPLDGSTSGRVMLSNYLPYVLGVLGVLVVVGGAIYLWQSSRVGGPRRKRHAGSTERAESRKGDVYCPQCGTRAERGDRFCRVCGTKLRPPE